MAVFGAHFAADLEQRAASGSAQARVPAALGLFRIQRERRAVLEVRGSGTQRAADDLAPAALGLDAEPVAAGSARTQQASAAAPADEVEAQRKPAVDRELVALAVLDDQVKRVAATFLGVPVLVETQVVGANRRPEEEAAAAAFVGNAAAQRHQRAGPVALDILLDRLGAGGAGKCAAAAE